MLSIHTRSAYTINKQKIVIPPGIRLAAVLRIGILWWSLTVTGCCSKPEGV